jgi:hypothetical protein
VEVAVGVLRPFIGSGRQGGGRQGSDGSGGALSRWWPATEGEAKRRRRRLREGKGGGRVTTGPMRGGGRRRTAARGATDRATALGCLKPEVEDEASGLDRAGLGHAGRVATRPKGLFGLKNERKRKTGCRTIRSNFSNKDLILKAKDSNTFKPKFELEPNWDKLK